MKKLGILAASDPRLPTTWSGTPSKLLEALEAQGVPCVTYALDKRTGRTMPEKFVRFISHGAAPYSKTCLRPQLYDLARYFKSTDCNDVLHMPGNIAMPFPGACTGLRHHAFLDSTFRQYWVPWFRQHHRARGGFLKQCLSFEMSRREKFYQSCLTQCSRFFVTTPWVKESLVNDYSVDPDLVSVCFTGTGNIRCLDLKRDPDHPLLLFVAKHNYIHKGATLVLEAFRRLRENHHTAELVMVGPDPKMIGAESCESRVTFHPFLEWEKLERLFNSASLFVMPSLYEPYGLVYLEAFRCGVPIVCSASGGMSSIVRDHGCGWTVDQNVPDELYMTMLDALHDLDGCRAKGRNGQSFVASNCSWEKCAEAITGALKY